MHSSVTLLSGRMRCEVLPSLGGSLAGLWCGEAPVLRAAAPGLTHTVRDAASYPLIPYSNRIGFARLLWEGAHYALTPNFAPEPHAIHGVGWERAWNIEQQDRNAVRLTYQHAGDSAWPFAFLGTQTLKLTPDGLEMGLEIRNTAAVPAPVGLGWHPYFVKNMETRIQFAARGRWEMGPDKLPTRRVDDAGLDTDCRHLEVDHCFDGWDGSVHLRSGKLKMTVQSDLGYLVVFTNPARDTIAVEPVSHVNNALTLAAHGERTAQQLGVQVLQPDAAYACSMRITAEEMP